MKATTGQTGRHRLVQPGHLEISNYRATYRATGNEWADLKYTEWMVPTTEWVGYTLMYTVLGTEWAG